MKKILVVEDNQLLRENIAEILEIEGYTAITAVNGADGVKKALEQIPDLIISDVNMPKMDGFEMLQALRKAEETRVTPFIFLTVKDTMSDMRQGMNLGADDYLAKPFDMDELLKAVANRFERRSSVLQQEVDKYDKLQNRVGEIITGVMDKPLKNIERLSELLRAEAAGLKTEDIEEISKIICEDVGSLRYEISHILFYHKTIALQDQPDELERYKQKHTSDTANQIKSTSINTAQNYRREQDLIMAIKDQPVKIPSDFLAYITKELVDNAFKYSPSNTSVKVSANNNEDRYQITVQDRGIGFPFDDINTYVPYVGDEKSENSGLGLSLINIRNIVNLFDGEISVSSDEDVGTSFKVTIPLA